MSEQDLAPSPMDKKAQQLSEEVVIPLIEEQLVISKRVVTTGTVRLHIRAEEQSETIQVPLTRVQWYVDHVPVDQVITEQPQVRQEGETTIYPVVEERVRIIRELVLIEEVRVTRHAVTTMETSSHILKRERIVEERIPAVPQRS